MKIGLQITGFKPENGDIGIRDYIKDASITAEKANYYSLWVMDHFKHIEQFSL